MHGVFGNADTDSNPGDTGNLPQTMWVSSGKARKLLRNHWNAQVGSHGDI